ncbi:hypothetical protein CPT_Minot_091 [Acinetobacter phage Minot]|nr:hypothetical protein CPT_Minot_091 [Acinetobacter phage Minot]QQO96542.1 hypothetical protein CPT_Mokit_091 [Acinetobacter phage Mokit]QQO96797.1 hypothetical protein CPT_Melin_096 [Acinetobacter phage Melin]
MTYEMIKEIVEKFPCEIITPGVRRDCVPRVNIDHNTLVQIKSRNTQSEKDMAFMTATEVLEYKSMCIKELYDKN